MHSPTRGRCAYGYAAAESVYDAVEGRRTFRAPPHPICHNHGTARPSAMPDDGVAKVFGRAHDVSNSIVSDGTVMPSSDAASRTLTTVALAPLQSDPIEAQRRAAAL